MPHFSKFRKMSQDLTLKVGQIINIAKQPNIHTDFKVLSLLSQIETITHLLTDVLSEALAKGNGDTDKSSGPRLIPTGIDCRNNSFLSVNIFKALSHRLLNICHAYNSDTRSFIASKSTTG